MHAKTSGSNAVDSDTAVVLHSGGLDSTVCLLLALEQRRRTISLGIDYGQTHSIELAYALRQAERFGVERRVLEVRWDKPSRETPRDRTVTEIRQGRSPAFLPGRNLVFLALAAAESAGLGAAELWIGINSIDFSGYPDCTGAFPICPERGWTKGPDSSSVRVPRRHPWPMALGTSSDTKSVPRNWS